MKRLRDYYRRALNDQRRRDATPPAPAPATKGAAKKAALAAAPAALAVPAEEAALKAAVAQWTADRNEAIRLAGQARPKRST